MVPSRQQHREKQRSCSETPDEIPRKPSYNFSICSSLCPPSILLLVSRAWRLNLTCVLSHEKYLWELEPAKVALTHHSIECCSRENRVLIQSCGNIKLTPKRDGHRLPNLWLCAYCRNYRGTLSFLQNSPSPLRSENYATGLTAPTGFTCNGVICEFLEFLSVWVCLNPWSQMVCITLG
jgi:hypothetical protein